MPHHKALPDPEECPTVDLWPTTANALDIGRAAVYAAAARGEIPTIKVGRLVRVPTAALRTMLGLDTLSRPPDETAA